MRSASGAEVAVAIWPNRSPVRFLMPILRAEPDHFPESLFAGGGQCKLGQGHWWVLHAKPRQEKSLARCLTATQTPHYLPTIPRRFCVRGRIVTSHIPLFTGYVFIHADHERRVAALTTNRIVRCLEVTDQVRLWDDLCQVNQLIASGKPITPEARITVGTPVEVISGPLSGLHGVVVRSATGKRFVVKIDFIEQGASVLIDDFALMPTERITVGTN